MTRLNPNAEKIMRLIIGEGFEAAERFVEHDLADRMENAKLAYFNLQLELTAARDLLKLAKGSQESSEPEQTPAEPPEGGLSIYSRALVLTAADEVAPNVGDQVSTADVLKVVTAKGQTPPGNKPGTSIGNFLNKDGRWQRVSEGVYRRVG